MLSDYLNEIVLYEEKTTKNNHNEYSYLSAISINVRKRPTCKVIKKPNKEEITITTIYYTEHVCTENSKIDGKSILYVYPWEDLEGDQIGYKVMT